MTPNDLPLYRGSFRQSITVLATAAASGRFMASWTFPSTITVNHKPNLYWRQARWGVLPEWNQRCVHVTKVVGEADNLRHTAEVLAQGNAVTISHVRLVKEASGGVKCRPERNAIKMLLHQCSNLASVDESAFWRNLFVVSDNYALLGEVLQNQTLRASLAGFVNDHHVEDFRLCFDLFCHPVKRHDPRGNSITALLHVLARVPTMRLSVLPRPLADLS